MEEDIYAKLVDHYKSGLYGLTLQVLEPDAIEIFKEALKQFFTPDEAKLAIQLKYTPETLADLCKRTGEADPFVEKMIIWWEDVKLRDDGLEIKPSPLRALPVEVEIEKIGGILPYENITQVIRKQDYIAVAECYCRKPKRLIGQECCDHPLDVCLVFGSMAQYLVNYGYGNLQQGETLALIKDCEERGLVHMSDNIYSCGRMRSALIRPLSIMGK